MGLCDGGSLDDHPLLDQHVLDLPSDHVLVALGPAVGLAGVDALECCSELGGIQPVGEQGQLLDGGGADLVQTP